MNSIKIFSLLVFMAPFLSTHALTEHFTKATPGNAVLKAVDGSNFFHHDITILNKMSDKPLYVMVAGPFQLNGATSNSIYALHLSSGLIGNYVTKIEPEKLNKWRFSNLVPNILDQSVYSYDANVTENNVYFITSETPDFKKTQLIKYYLQGSKDSLGGNPDYTVNPEELGKYAHFISVATSNNSFLEGSFIEPFPLPIDNITTTTISYKGLPSDEDLTSASELKQGKIVLLRQPTVEGFDYSEYEGSFLAFGIGGLVAQPRQTDDDPLTAMKMKDQGDIFSYDIDKKWLYVDDEHSFVDDYCLTKNNYIPGFSDLVSCVRIGDEKGDMLILESVLDEDYFHITRVTPDDRVTYLTMHSEKHPGDTLNANLKFTNNKAHAAVFHIIEPVEVTLKVDPDDSQALAALDHIDVYVDCYSQSRDSTRIKRSSEPGEYSSMWSPEKGQLDAGRTYINELNSSKKVWDTGLCRLIIRNKCGNIYYTPILDPFYRDSTRNYYEFNHDDLFLYINTLMFDTGNKKGFDLNLSSTK